MSTTPKDAERPGALTSLRAGINAGALAGFVAGGVEGSLALLGVDPSVFGYQVGRFGLFEALGMGLPAAHELPALLGCLAAAICVYAGCGMALGAGLGLAAHPLLRGRTLTGRYERLLGWLLGGWLGAMLFWWSRPLFFSHLSIRDPRKLATLGAALLLGLGVGLLLPRLRRVAPRGLRRATPFAILVTVVLGGGYLYLQDRQQGSRGAVNERTADLPNVLLVVVDALRADVIGAYGSEEVRTPNIDRLADEGVLFRNAFVQAPFTWTSFGSLLTAKYPRRHGLVVMGSGVRMAPNLTLALHLGQAERRDGRALEEGDYVRGAFMTGTVSHGSGLLQGFDQYLEAMVGHGVVDVHDTWSEFRSHLLPWLVTSKLGQQASRTYVVDAARQWLRRNRDRRFMALVHLYSTHTAYDPPTEFLDLYADPDYDGPIDVFDSEARRAIESGELTLTEADARRIRDLYRGGVTQADRDIGLLVQQLEDLDLLDDTIVVVTSDHGESLGEHGLWEHLWMYEDNLRVPLVMRYPPGLPPGTEVAAPVDEIDVLPTLLDLMGLEPLPHAEDLPADVDPRDPAHRFEVHERVDGRSLLPVVRGESQRVRPYTFAENGRFVSISDGTWKLIAHIHLAEPGAWEALRDRPRDTWPPQSVRLFDLSADPLELVELSEARPEQVERLMAALVAHDRRLPIRTDLIRLSARDEENELMQALGYSGVVGDERALDGEADGPTDGPDPDGSDPEGSDPKGSVPDDAGPGAPEDDPPPSEER